MGGFATRKEEARNAYKILVENPEGKNRLERPRDRSEDNIKTDIKEIGCDGWDSIYLAQGRNLVNTITNLWDL
jgi:hypothetical protein